MSCFLDFFSDERRREFNPLTAHMRPARAISVDHGRVYTFVSIEYTPIKVIGVRGGHNAYIS
jgi:hypothetical protein